MEPRHLAPKARSPYTPSEREREEKEGHREEEKDPKMVQGLSMQWTEMTSEMPWCSSE